MTENTRSQMDRLLDGVSARDLPSPETTALVNFLADEVDRLRVEMMDRTDPRPMWGRDAVKMKPGVMTEVRVPPDWMENQPTPAPTASGEMDVWDRYQKAIKMVEGDIVALSDGAIYRIMGDDGGDLGDHAPADPTLDMIEAGKGVEIEGLDGCLNPEELVAIWRAMEAAKR